MGIPRELPASGLGATAHGHLGHPYVFERLKDALGAASALIFAADATNDLYEPYVGAGRMVTAPYGLVLGDIQRFRAT